MNADLSVLVIGGGPAGATAALQARELGARVTLLEAAQIGGTTLNRGPAPVRTLARAARLVRDWSSWATFGLDGPPPVPNLPAILANNERVARYAHDKKDLTGHLRRHGIDLFEDIGRVGFTDPHTVAARDGRRWSADRIILAVGGHAARLPIPGAEHALTYEDIPSLTSLPRRVAVIGGASSRKSGATSEPTTESPRSPRHGGGWCARARVGTRGGRRTRAVPPRRHRSLPFGHSSELLPQSC
jgi:pyruvate/2-oxoglutarate dehydrogenase complex dihydrolipoamide dehydrogenase (E3) component